MKNDPCFEEYLSLFSSLYEGKHYKEGLSGYFLSKSHLWSESYFDKTFVFKTVLEVGAGSGIHVKYVNHQFDKYIISDLNQPMLEEFHGDERYSDCEIVTQIQNASNLTLEDNSGDRLIATHVLEHLYKPHEVLREWNRVVKPNGVITILLPCDPGLAWRIGRAVGVRKKMITAGLVDYDYWMAREHVNPINNLISFIRYYFEDVVEEWYPFRVPSIDMNLFYVAHIRVNK